MIHILLCDDEEKILDRIRKYIDSICCELKYEIDIETYSDAESVLQRVRSSRECNDILITDIDMPNLSGMEMLQFEISVGLYSIRI